ncbi:E3 ubiquitin-protein ligase TRIM65-like isoform X1 [Mobula birostris]|uniref:E3 ubiquitin-protein ligase TRIM65-like isoform X1 n=1 Tax=Mobula birostris TaxID=1983395 RepID=UPI003B28D498
MDIQDELNCSICQTLFSCPVTIQCGHSFCTSCLENYWCHQNSLDCPLCRQHYPSRPQLCKNVTLSHICDVIKQRGTKALSTSCCPSHGDELTFYCCAEGCLMCGRCVCQDQMEHRILPLQWAVEQAQDSIRKQADAVETSLKETSEAKAKVSQQLASIWDDVSERGAGLIQALEGLLVATQEAQRQLESLLEGAAGCLQREAMAEDARLEMRELQLKERQRELLKMLSQDTVTLLQVWQTECVVEERPAPIRIGVEVWDALGGLREVVLELTKRLQSEVQTVARVCSPQPEPVCIPEHPDSQTPCPDDHPSNAPAPSGILHPESSTSTAVAVESTSCTVGMTVTDTVTERDLLRSPVPPVPGAMAEDWADTGAVNRQQLLKYWTAVTFDRSTASDYLWISEEGLVAKNLWPETQPYGANEQRFERVPQVLGLPALGECHYWEVAWSGTLVVVGVAHPLLPRRGRGTACLLGRNPLSWGLELLQDTATPLHQNQPGPKVHLASPNIGLFLDLPRQSLALYSIGHNCSLTHLHSFALTAPPPLIPAFYIHRGTTVRILPRN